MPLFSQVNKENIYFIHIPKVGGASIENLLRKKYNMSFHFTDYKKIGFLCSPQHFHAEIVESLFHPSIYDNSFAIVRNPVSRFISEYKYRMDQRVNNNKAVLNINDFLTSVVSAYKKDNYFYDNHLRPQSEFIHKRTRVYKFESGLKNSLIEEGLIDTNDLVPHVNNSKGKLSLDVKLTTESKEILFELYKSDFLQFNYEL